MNNHDLLIAIDARTKQTADDVFTIKGEIADLHREIDMLKLHQARLDGAIETLKWLLSLVGLAGIAALVKAFM